MDIDEENNEEETLSLPPLEVEEEETSETESAHAEGKISVRGDAAELREQAFLLENNAWRTLSFGGPDGGAVALQAFSPRRQAAAQGIGMHFLNFDSDTVEELQRTGSYNGMFLDAVLAIYLCTRPKSTTFKALRAPSSVQEDALNWMDRNSVVIGSERHAEVIDAFGDIVNGIFAAAAEVEDSGAAPTGESLGE